MKPFEAQTSSAPWNNKDLFVMFSALRTQTAALLFHLVLSVDLAPAQTAAAPANPTPRAHLQVFGDLFIDSRALATTSPNGGPEELFSGVRDLLDTSQFNLVNFEGAATRAWRGLPSKEFHLRMPLSIPRLLAKAGIDGVTLANNHSMDFGWMGLFETLSGLKRAGLSYAGAGEHYAAASQPIILSNEFGRICVLSFARTYPESAWASPSRPGTANPSPEHLRNSIRDCTTTGSAPIVVFHWGRELERSPQPYQRELGRIAIEAGAVAVVGHHPHVLQEIEVYLGRPIFYSIGNFLFSSIPQHTKAEGMGIRMTWSSPVDITFELVPLLVDNRKTNYRVRTLISKDQDPLQMLILPALSKSCSWLSDSQRWRCRF